MRSTAQRSFHSERSSRFLPALVALIILLCACLLMPAQTHAVSLGIQIEVFKNGFSQGTAFGGASTTTNTPLIVIAYPGDTLRFLVRFDQTPSGNYTAWMTDITANDPTLIDFINGSGTTFGIPFAGLLGNPNNSLNDATPGAGAANSQAGSSSSRNLYRVDYVVTGFAGDTLRDFTVALHAFSPEIGSNDTGNLLKGTASVTIWPPIPEPATLLLLGSGLAGLACFARQRRR